MNYIKNYIDYKCIYFQNINEFTSTVNFSISQIDLKNSKWDFLWNRECY